MKEEEKMKTAKGRERRESNFVADHLLFGEYVYI